MLRILVTMLLVFSIAAAAAADVTVVQKVEIKETDIDPKYEKKTEQVQTMMFKEKKVRIDTKDEKTYNLADFEKNVFQTVDPEKKTYSKISFDDLKEWRDALFLPIQQRLSLLEMLPPARKAEFEFEHGPKIKKCREDLAKKDKDTKVEVKKLDEEKEIAGYKCRRVVIEEDGEAVIELWLTDKIDVKVNLSEILGKLLPFSKSVKKAIKDLKGFSLKTKATISIGGHTYTNSSEAKEVKTDDLKKEKFDIPEEYKEVEDTSPMFAPIRQYKKWKKAQEKKEEEGEKQPEEKEEPKEEPEKEEPEKTPPPVPDQPKKGDQGEKGSR